MRIPCPLILFALACPAAATPQTSPFPTRMPEYSWQPDLAAARKAVSPGKPVVLYSVPTIALRDQIHWLEKQRGIFESEATRALLDGVPLLAVGPGRQAPKALRKLPLPQIGFAVLDADGAIGAKVGIQGRSRARILAELARALRRAAPDARGAPEDGRRRYRAKRRELETLLKAGKRAEAAALVATERKRAAGSFYPRLLAAELRRARRAAEPPVAGARERLAICVVVRDRSAFLRALEAWGAGPIFPILYADAHLLPRFVEAWGPTDLYFLGETAKKPRGTPDAKRVLAAWAKSLGLRRAPKDEEQALAAFGALDPRSPGLVLTHPDAAQCEAGLALAAGHRQALAFAEPTPKPMKIVDRGTLDALRARFAGIEGVGSLTIALDLPYRYRDALYNDRTPLAVDDALLRDDYDLPTGAVGRLVGDSTRTLYQAMCSLFLTPERALLFSRYNREKQPWKAYDTTPAAELLEGKLPFTQVQHPDATLAKWREIFAEPSTFGLVHVNSSGGARNWSTSKGGANDKDIPLTVPAIVSYTHSGSAANVYSDDTIAGRWLANGAYFYFGSSHEPYLDAFVPIHRVYERALAGEPLGQAFRQRIGVQRWRPWKLVCLGDPLLRLDFVRYATKKPSKPPLPRLIPLKSAARRNPFKLGKTELADFRALVKRLAARR